MEILGITVLLSAFLNFLLGLFVFLKAPKKKINQLFGICGFFTAIWVFNNFMMGLRSSVFWLKSTSAFGALVPITAILWVLELCDKKITKSALISLVTLGLLFFILSYTNNLIASEVIRIYLGGFEGKTGPLFPFYFIYIVGLLSFIGYVLISTYRKAKGIKKLQISYVLIGAILYIAIVLIVSFILPLFGILKFTALDSPSSLFLLFFTALAITKYHLFGIEVILTEILVGAIGILLVVQIFSAPTILWRFVSGGIFVLFCIFSWLLIRYTFREIKRREEAERLSQAKTEFLSIASHQLRTPLTVIKGYLSMVLEGSYGVLSEKLKKIIENVYTSNERLIKLVNDFLNVSRIETGKTELELERVNLEELIENQIKELEIRAKEKGIYLNLEKPKERVPQLLLDKEKIGQALLNLIDNGIRYTHLGGITISFEKLKNSVRVKIKDTGEGMTKEEIGKLFESFSRGSAGTRFYIEGAGLGLYIAKKLVEIHKGKIWAESEGKGKGSTFFVELPIK